MKNRKKGENERTHWISGTIFHMCCCFSYVWALEYVLNQICLLIGSWGYVLFILRMVFNVLTDSFAMPVVWGGASGRFSGCVSIVVSSCFRSLCRTFFSGKCVYNQAKTLQSPSKALDKGSNPPICLTRCLALMHFCNQLFCE